ncbi:HGxxPAAW family protein [Kribbella sp. NPDC005582]|uniref:HGxxPAAW family protein n=1 Tax=Kribbella sp. NPDC005582 TaxID=3156893 RepID=UPI0033B2F22B
MDNTTADQAVTRAGNEAHAVAHHDAHGNSTAAWTAVAIILVGFTVGAIAMVLGPNWLLFWISVGIVVLGALAGKVLQLLGFGVPADDH